MQTVNVKKESAQTNNTALESRLRIGHGATEPKIFETAEGGLHGLASSVRQTFQRQGQERTNVKI